MKVHLRKRKMRLKKGTSKPRYSLYLDIYYRKGKRKREFLGIYLEPNEDKTYRNEKLKLAENIKAKRMMELANEAHGFPTKDKLNQNFIAYFEKQMNKREGNSRVAWKITLTHLKRWCGDVSFVTGMKLLFPHKYVVLIDIHQLQEEINTPRCIYSFVMQHLNIIL